MRKIKSYIWMLPALLLLSSCELYMDELESPESYEEGSDPKKELVTERTDGAEVSYSYTEETIELTDQYDQYIMVNDNDSIFYFRADTPYDFLPAPGNVLFSKMREQFPTGLARKVNEVKKENGMFTVVTEKAYYTEVFTDLKFDLTGIEYPTIEYTNYADAEQRLIKRPASSRAEGDVLIKDGQKFTRTTKLEVHLSANPKFEFYKIASVTVTGDITFIIEEYEANIKDQMDVFDGNIYQYTLSMTKMTMKGEGSIKGSFSYKPFKFLADQLAAAGSGGMLGMVLYPDVTITFSGEFNFNGTYTQTKVIEKIVRFDKFVKHKDTNIKEIKDKYGAGTESDFDISGTIKMDVSILLRLGVSVAGGVLEAGVYFDIPLTFGITIDSDDNCKELTIDLANGPRTYKPRSNTHTFLEFGVKGAGLYLRVGVPYSLRDTFDKLPEKFSKGLDASIKYKDFIEAKYDAKEKEGFVFFNLVALIKLNKLHSTKKWYFYPDISTKDSYMLCSNLTDIDREYNQLKGEIYFNYEGLYDYEHLEFLIFDSQDRYVTHVDCKNDVGQLRAISNNKKKVYKLEYKAPIVWDLTYDDDYYKVYPCYREKRTSPNSNASPGDEYWNFYSDREFMIKNYRPCANVKRHYQNSFSIDMPNEKGNFYFNYSVRLHTQILTSPEIKDWGFTVFYATDRNPLMKINEKNMAKCKKVGTQYLMPNTNGKRTYLTSSVTTIVEISFQIKNTTAAQHCLYFVPTYKDPALTEATLLYSDGVGVKLQDDDTLIDIYGDDELADQYF